eukprot:m.150852 g.150852  ORF g.150852 m.150852 type:complete len:273 (-) comp16324_c0_seq3:63-881(-)
MATAQLVQPLQLTITSTLEHVEPNPITPAALGRGLTRSLSLPALLESPVFHVDVEQAPASATTQAIPATALAATPAASAQLQTLPSNLKGPREPDVHNPDNCPVCKIEVNYAVSLSHSAAKEECPICGEVKVLHYVVRYIEVIVKPLICDHSFCKDCLLQWYTPKVNDGALRLQCVESGCRAQLSLDDVHAIDEVLADKFRATQQQSYDDRETSEFTELMKVNEIVPCPACSTLIQRSEGCNSMVCSQCLCEFCYDCGDEFEVPEYMCACCR